MSNLHSKACIKGISQWTHLDHQLTGSYSTCMILLSSSPGDRMPVRNLSSTVRFKASDTSPEVRRRYGLYDDNAVEAAELDHHSGEAWKQDQRLKNDITSVLQRLELESVKPSFDVLAQTGFRRGYQVRRRSPGDALLAPPHQNAADRGRKPSRRHSYIEPRVVHHQHLETTEHAAPVHVERTVRFTEPEPAVHHHRERSYSPSWYYTEPSSYSFVQRTAPPVRRTVAQPEGGRALSEYRDTLVAVPSQPQHHQHQRWSVYGMTPSTDWRRSQSTPPDVYRMSTATGAFGAGSGGRIPIGDKLTRRRNHEFAIGVKLADSQRELDTFNRMLDKRFGDSGSSTTPNYGVYPSYYPSTYYTSPLFYEYTTPAVSSTDYRYHTYSPRTRVVKPSGTLAYGNPYSYSDYVPYTTAYSKYVPYSSYGRSSFSVYEPGYASYPRSGYYVGRSRYLL